MLLQVIALVLAFSTRKVKVKGLDDSKSIAAAIYITSIMFAVIMVATYTLKDFVNGFAALFCTGFLIGTTVILGLVFVPKVGAVASEAYHDWSGEAADAQLRVNFTLKLLLSQNFCNQPLMRFISFASNIGPAAAVPAGPAPSPLRGV